MRVRAIPISTERFGCRGNTSRSALSTGIGTPTFLIGQDVEALPLASTRRPVQFRTQARVQWSETRLGLRVRLCRLHPVSPASPDRQAGVLIYEGRTQSEIRDHGQVLIICD